MNFPRPEWITDVPETFVGGEDQLGVEGAAQNYQQWLIPGIITTTDRARYYSFYAWVLYRFINMPGSSRLLKDFRGPFFKRHEVAFIVGAYSNHSAIAGLVGSGINNHKVRTWWEASDPVLLDVPYFQNQLGGFGQYYLTAMQAMGIVGTSEHPSWVYRLMARGDDLAKAYQAAIAETAYANKLESAGQLTRLSHADALEYGKHGCLCPESLALGGDLPLLRDAFFRFDQQGDNPHVRRRLALTVALDLVRGANGRFTREMLRPALYLGQYQAGLTYQPTPAIQDWVWRWKLVEIRHLYTFGLQCLWAAFLLMLRDRPKGLSMAEYSELVQQSLGQAVYERPLADLLDEVCSEVGLVSGWVTTDQSFGQACLLESGKDEYTRYQEASKSHADPHKLLEHGLQILARLYLRYRRCDLQNDLVWLEMAQRQRLPLQGFCRMMADNLSRDGYTVGSWLMHLYQEYIWGQHEFIALEKLRYQQYDTFKFYYRDGRFYWPFDAPEAYREPIRLAANRLANALSILVDLGLVVKNEDGVHTLSEDGDAFFTKSVEAYLHD